MTKDSLAKTGRFEPSDFPAGDQLDDPAEHHNLIHTAPHGDVIYWMAPAGRRASPADRGRHLKVKPHHHVPDLVGPLAGQPDTYVTVNQFRGWRQFKLLESIRACYVDVDNCEDVPGVLEALHDAGLPEPSFLIRSGRGLHLYWILEPTPGKAASYWAAIQRQLIAALQPLGADPRARDAARILRVAGTRHVTAARAVEGVILDSTPWHIDDLAAEVLPYSRSEVRDFRAAAAKRRAQKAARTRQRRQSGSSHQRGIGTWWQNIYSEIWTIIDEHRGSVPEGHRDTVLFLACNALSYFTRAETLRDEIVSVARSCTPGLSRDEVLSSMNTAIRRAEHEADAEARGERVPRSEGRYWFRRETLREWLGDLITDKIEPQLTALASDETLAQRKRERDSARWGDSYTGRGYRASRADEAASARFMAAQGYSQRAIAREFGVHLRTVQRWLSGG